MKNNRRILLIAVIVAVIIAIITTAIFWLQAKKAKEQEEYFQCKTPPAPTLTPSLESEEEVVESNDLSAELPELPVVEFLGMTVFKTGEKFEKTEIGGLSAIAYDAEQDVYYVLSDDRGRPDDARFYTVSIASDGSEVTFEGITFLVDEEGKMVQAGTYDTEGIAFWGKSLFISSEGNAGMLPSMDPGMSEFNLSGERSSQFPVPEKFLPDGHEKTGIRNNKSFEALAISPDGTILTTAVENALVQDGPAASYEDESYCRILQIDVNTLQPMTEYVYVTGVIPVDSNTSGDNGLVELIALDNEGNYLALERSYVSGYGNTIQLYQTSTDGATQVSDIATLWEDGAPTDFVPMQKTLITKLSDLGIDPDNIEGMTFGPLLADGRRMLVLVSDNNFNDSQETQFIVLAIQVE